MSLFPEDESPQDFVALIRNYADGAAMQTARRAMTWDSIRYKFMEFEDRVQRMQDCALMFERDLVQCMMDAREACLYARDALEWCMLYARSCKGERIPRVILEDTRAPSCVREKWAALVKTGEERILMRDVRAALETESEHASI